MAKVSTRTPPLISLYFCQERGDPDYGSCLWKALTNADRMRAATNQQLAKLLYDNQKEFCRLMYKNLGFEDELTFSEDYSDILAWLNAPAEMGVVAAVNELRENHE